MLKQMLLRAAGHGFAVGIDSRSIEQEGLELAAASLADVLNASTVRARALLELTKRTDFSQWVRKGRNNVQIADEAIELAARHRLIGDRFDAPAFIRNLTGDSDSSLG